MSRTFGKTLREAPADAEIASHQLLIRANYVRPLSAGIYTYMPLGYRVLRKIWRILSEEMDAIGGQEMWMPNLHPRSIWHATGRFVVFGSVLIKVTSDGGREYVLSPTHEEVVNDITLSDVDSYRDLPRMVYHVSKKFRDEPRARGGLIRMREFIMKDAYTLDLSEEGLDEHYPYLYQAYVNIFERCHLEAVPILADVGAMGGKSSHEFTVPHPQGEDTYIACSNCDYAANVEAAEFVREGEQPDELEPLTKVATPDSKTIAAVANYVGVPVSQTIKAVFYWFTPAGAAESEGRFIFGIVRGDLDVNEVKLVNRLGVGELRAATEAEIESIGAVPGYASPVGLDIAASLEDAGPVVVADPSIEYGGNFVIGANDEGYHYKGANYPRDFSITLMADIAQADTGHQCPVCGGRIESRRGIEVGHCFKLGTRYSVATGATYLDENNEPQYIHMGSYGIGLDRLMAVVVEIHHDDDGIIWPDELAPYDVHLLWLGRAGDEVVEVAEELYGELQAAGLDVFYDDREASAGVKFKDADLIGIPWRVAVGGRSLAQGGVEVKRRDESERHIVPVDELADFLRRS
ncbi:MAG: proline--tRNA ligase [Candidatus Promineifilaceae bacterium]|nr:proline--tRNA ligase [Candidatus Promineifilaceae bacterium]